MTAVKPSPSPRPAAPEISLGDRVAADLRVLADVAAHHPALAPDLARTVEQLYVVLTSGSDLNPEDFGDALVQRGAELVPAALVEPLWATQAWTLPAGAIRLTVTQLAVPIADVADLVPTGES